MKAARWIGFALIAIALIGLPVAMWLAGQWWLVLATLGTLGIAVLGFASRQPPPEDGPLPTHGSDFGLFIHAEVLGMKRIIFVKDEDGLFDKDPKKHSDAKQIKKTTLGRLLAEMPEEMALDKELFSAWKTGRHVERIQIVNGLRPGELTRALAGEDVGTVIEKEKIDA